MYFRLMQRLSILLFVLAALRGFAQDTEPSPVYMGLELGLGTGANVQLAGGTRQWYVGLDFSYWTNGGLIANDEVNAFSMLGGYKLTPATSRVSVRAGGGIGFVSFLPADSFSLSANGPPRPPRETGVGLHTELAVTWQFSRYVGLGSKLQGNLNGARSFGNFLISLQFGKLR